MSEVPLWKENVLYTISCVIKSQFLWFFFLAFFGGVGWDSGVARIGSPQLLEVGLAGGTSKKGP